MQSLGAFDSVPPLAANFQSLLEADLCVEFGTSAWTAQKAGDGSGAPDIDALLEQLVEDLAQVLGGLQELAEPADGVDASPSPTGSALGSSELAELRALLEDDDSEALDAVEALLRLDIDAPSRRMLAAVGESLAGYDFDRALQAVIGFVHNSGEA